MGRDQKDFGLCQRWERGNMTRTFSPVKGGGRVSMELTSRTFLPSSGISQPQLLLLFFRRNTVAQPPSTSPSPREGQRLCPCRGVTTSPGTLGLALPPSQRLSQGDQFVQLQYLPNKRKIFAQLFCAHVSQNHWGLFLRGYWFKSSLHWWKELLPGLHRRGWQWRSSRH